MNPGRRILIAADERDQRVLLASELGEEGSLTFAESGTDAIALIAALPAISAVVTDFDLGPGPTGFDVLRAARARNPGCACILLTANSLMSLDHQTASFVDTVFGKPWVIGTIRRYLRTRC